MTEVGFGILVVDVEHSDQETALQWWSAVFSSFSIPFPILALKLLHVEICLVRKYYSFSLTSNLKKVGILGHQKIA
jgi:hypothetical protein